MRQVFKKQKPTEATYFQSESQRKHTSRLSFIYGSKQLVAVLSILVVGSAITGIAIVQRQNDSSAATQRVSINSNTFDRWNFVNTTDQRISSAKANNLMSVTIPTTPNLALQAGAEGCLVIDLSSSPEKVTNANFSVKSNTNITSAFIIKRNGAEVQRFTSPVGQGQQLADNTPFDFQLVSVTFPNPTAGGNISLCMQVLESRKFNIERRFIISGYSIFGDREAAKINSYAPGASTPPPATMTNGDTAQVSIQVTNSGNTTWLNDDANPSNPVRLGTLDGANGKDSASLFHNEGDGNWIGRSRVKMQQREVAPGGVATFSFTMVARSTDANSPLKRMQYFNLVQEGVTWFPYKGLAFQMDVKPKSSNSANPNDDTPGTGAVTTPSCSVAARPMEKNPVGAADLNPVGTPKPEKINDGGTEAYVLKEKDQGVDCYIKLPQGSQPGAYVLGFSAKGKKDTLVDLVMVSGESSGQQLQRSTKKFTQDYTYSTDVPQLARMPINYGASGSNASEKTIRIMNPGDVVRARFILKSGSANVANLQLYRDPCSDNAGNDIRSTTEDPTCKLAIKESFEQEQERKAIQDAENGNSPKPGNNDAPAGNEGQAPSSAPAAPVAPATCEAASGATSKRAIEAVRSSEGTVTVPDNGEGNVVALITNKGTLECTFTVPADKDGDHFAARAKVRGDEVLGKRPQATISLSTADKTVSQEQINSPKGNAWGKVGFNQKDKFTVLKAGDKVTVKVQFTNDTSNSKGLDRNLFVSDIYLESVGKRTDNSPAPASPTPGLNTDTACKSTGTSKEAENALASGKVELANNIGEASNGKAAKILDITGKVECTLKAGEAGRYSISTRLKGSDDSKVVLAGKIDGQEEQKSEIVLGKSTWENFDTVQNSDPDLLFSLTAGQEITVSISSTNARSGFIGNKHVFVDHFRIVKEAEPGTTSLPAVTLPPTRGSAQIIQTITGQTANYPNLSVEAVSNDTIVSEGIRKSPDTSREITLDRENASIEYTFNVTTEDVYGIGFIGRGQSFEGKLPEAEIRIKSEKNTNFQNIRKYDTYQIRDDQNRLYTASEKQRLEPGKYTVRVQLKNYDSDATSTRSVTVKSLNLVGSTSDRKTIAAENGQKCTYKGISDSISCHELLVQDPAASGDQAISLRRKNDIVNMRVKIDSPGEYNFNIHLRSQSPNTTSAKAEVKIDGNKKTGDGVPVSKTEYERLSYSHSFTNTEPKWYNIEIKYLNDQCGENAKDCDTNNQTNDRDLLVDYVQFNKALEPAGGSSTPVLNVLSPAERVFTASNIKNLPKRADS